MSCFVVCTRVACMLSNVLPSEFPRSASCDEQNTPIGQLPRSMGIACGPRENCPTSTDYALGTDSCPSTGNYVQLHLCTCSFRIERNCRTMFHGTISLNMREALDKGLPQCSQISGTCRGRRAKAEAGQLLTCRAQACAIGCLRAAEARRADLDPYTATCTMLGNSHQVFLGLGHILPSPLQMLHVGGSTANQLQRSLALSSSLEQRLMKQFRVLGQVGPTSCTTLTHDVLDNGHGHAARSWRASCREAIPCTR
mmetsp:Transcript_103939/g.184283  ORF Transcript_103939/g.184283 Transcript_103939/m.184283 type:complete len:254 (+) Transcript_103939:3-764(+)